MSIEVYVGIHTYIQINLLSFKLQAIILLALYCIYSSTGILFEMSGFSSGEYSVANVSKEKTFILCLFRPRTGVYSRKSIKTKFSCTSIYGVRVGYIK